MIDYRAWAVVLRAALWEFRFLVQEHLERFTSELSSWVNALIARPLPADWREQLAQFLANWEQQGYQLSPSSKATLEWWIEAWAARRASLRCARQAIGPKAGIQAGSVKANTADDTMHTCRVCDGPPSHLEPTETLSGRGIANAQDVAERPLVRSATHSDSERVVVQQVAVRRSVGHHWLPVSAIGDKTLRPRLSKEAMEYAMGSYSGPTSPSHNARRYGGITHREYNQIVKGELRKFLDRYKIKKMTAQQMEQFITLIKTGRGAYGQRKSKIDSFNKAIRKAVLKGTSVPSKMDDIIAAGRKYMKTSRFRALAAGAVVAGLLGEAIGDQVEMLDVAAKSRHFRLALEALENGDRGKARVHLIGENDSLYVEFQSVGAVSALNFKVAVERAFAMANEVRYD